jgi:hypothetical protein
MKQATDDALTKSNSKARFEEAAANIPVMPHFDGRGIIITAGGPFVPSAYVGIRMLRKLGVKLPIEIWHAGEDEIPSWARRAMLSWDVQLFDVMQYCPERPLSEMRGWPIKPAALMFSKLREVLFLDADCFPLVSPEFLFDSREYRESRALFWPDNQFHKLIAGAPIWELSGLNFQGDTEFETGIFLVDKVDCWRELSLTQWLNKNSNFWYEFVLGDKDTFYLAWRKLNRKYHIAPPCQRYRSIVTRHYWTNGQPLVDHRTGASKYSLPTKKGPFTTHLTPYQWRSPSKNFYDETMQRFFVRNFSTHVKFLDELNEYYQASL